LITDEAFTLPEFMRMQSMKKIRVRCEGSQVYLDIIGAEAVLKAGGREFLGFLVPFFADESLRNAIIGREIEVS